MTREKMVDLPPGLEGARRRFERWRRSRRAGSRIPQPLWNAAVKMAGQHGVNRTARVLRLDYYALRKRVENGTSSSPELNRDDAPTFLELAAPVSSGGCECILELEDATGSKLRVQLKNAEAPDLAELARSFRETEP